MFEQIALRLSTLVLGIALISTAIAKDYDLVINGGCVMDPETLYDDIANVGIKDGRIATITRKSISGKETIDAKGMFVAPGFFDTRFHWMAPLGMRSEPSDEMIHLPDGEVKMTGLRKLDARAIVPQGFANPFTGRATS